jgi:site-specific recombinase XerD
MYHIEGFRSVDFGKFLLEGKIIAPGKEKIYLGWVRQYLGYCRERNPLPELNAPCSPDLIRDFQAHLAMQKNVAASTQNQAFNSLLTFFRLVFNTELGDLKNAVRARTGHRLPVVFSPDEIRQLFKQAQGTIGLMLKLIYGGGLRVNECCLRNVAISSCPTAPIDPCCFY